MIKIYIFLKGNYVKNLLRKYFDVVHREFNVFCFSK